MAEKIKTVEESTIENEKSLKRAILKTSVFGFDRSSVNIYISSLKKQIYDLQQIAGVAREETPKEITEKNKQIERLERQVHEINDQLQHEKDTSTRLETECLRLTSEVEALQLRLTAGNDGTGNSAVAAEERKKIVDNALKKKIDTLSAELDRLKGEFTAEDTAVVPEQFSAPAPVAEQYAAPAQELASEFAQWSIPQQAPQQPQQPQSQIAPAPVAEHYAAPAQELANEFAQWSIPQQQAPQQAPQPQYNAPAAETYDNAWNAPSNHAQWAIPTPQQAPQQAPQQQYSAPAPQNNFQQPVQRQSAPGQPWGANIQAQNNTMPWAASAPIQNRQTFNPNPNYAPVQQQYGAPAFGTPETFGTPEAFGTPPPAYDGRNLQPIDPTRIDYGEALIPNDPTKIDWGTSLPANDPTKVEFGRALGGEIFDIYLESAGGDDMQVNPFAGTKNPDQLDNMDRMGFRPTVNF